jgi:heme iron utilization protein
MSDDDLPLLARQLIRGAPQATLATILPANGGPYASLVLTACDSDGSPLMLLSGLAEHTRNIAVDPRVSLLLDGTAGYEDPLTGPRLSVVGTATVTPVQRHRDRFLARHPQARAYADFGDFRFYRVTVERAHLVAGFGRIRWLDASDFLAGAGSGDDAPLIAAEAGIVAHMNGDHADTLDLYASALLGQTGSGWLMTGVDRDGIDLRRRERTARLAFAAPVHTPEEVRAELVRLAARARTVPRPPEEAR